MPDDRTDPYDLPANQTAINTATKGTPNVGRSQSRARSQSDGARQSGIGCLDVQGVGKSFAGRAVVKGASLHIERGEAVALLGPNGAGKTTIFYMITGLIPADRGRIELEGRDITRLPMYRRARLGIGYLPQEVSVFSELDVEQSIRAVLDVVESDHRRRAHDLEVLLEELDIARLRKRPSNVLSADERRRVQVARALAARPAYLLLDEPFADVEPMAIDGIQALVRHLTRNGIGVLITDQLDQNPRRTLDVSDRAYVICSGEVLGTLVP